MSYENTACPCGQKKERETMICAGCRETFSGTSYLKTSEDGTLSWEARRSAAITLLAMARRRNKGLALHYQF